jgi:hypothetical protein
MESDSQKPAARFGAGEAFFLLEERETGLEAPFLGLDFLPLGVDLDFLPGMGTFVCRENVETIIAQMVCFSLRYNCPDSFSVHYIKII